MRSKLTDRIKRIGILAIAILIAAASVPGKVYADNTISTTADGKDGNARITDIDRSDADAELLYYMNSMGVQFTLNETQDKKLHDLFDSAVYYIAYTDMTLSQLESYVATVKTDMYKTASTDVSAVTSEFIQVADNWDTPTVSYGQSVSIVLPIVNLGTEELNDLVVEPVISTDVKEWPFVPEQTGYIQTEPFIPGYVSIDNAMQNRREFTYRFKVREDVMTGYYELKFKISYTRAGVRVENDQAAKLSVYVHTIGKPESGVIGGNGSEDKKPKSKIIVTGYDTDKEKVFSGDTFNLTIHVQNTSSTTSVSNVLFGLSAATETIGAGTTADTITPFLPTSGSNSVYVASIAPGATTDLVIEMSAKAGLSQKSYVLDLNMSYDSGTQFDLTDKASISIPVYQESKFDISTPEVAPSSINVGSQANVMFSIYNTGKTSLYNTQVQFVADSIEQNMAFVGNLASGSTGNVDVMLTGIAPTMDDGTVKMIISYEDEAGNVTEVEKTCNIFVNEMMEEEFDDMGMDDMGMDEQANARSGGSLLRIIIIALIVVAVIGGIIAAVKIKGKKKAAAMHAEDLKDLEEIDDLDE